MLRVWKPVGGASAFGREEPGSDNIQVELLRYAAAERGIAIQPVEGSFWRMSFAGHTHSFSAAVPDTLSLVARRIAHSKQLTKTVLAGAGISVPRGAVFDSADKPAAWRFAQQLGLPVVIKPIHGSGGRAVTPGVSTEALFNLAWDVASAAQPHVVVEEMILGRDHRLLVVGDRMVLACWRSRAALVGDGVSSLTQLIERRNAMRAANPAFRHKLISLTPVMLHNLALDGVTPDTVIENDRRVLLTLVGNTALGGANLDVTEQVHADFAEIAVKARAALPGVLHIGIDLLVPDISRPAAEQRYAVCEANSAPDLAMHHFPIDGPGRDAAGELLAGLFPGSAPVPPEQWRRVGIGANGCPPWAAGVLWKLAALRAVAGRVQSLGPHGIAAELFGPPLAVDDVVRGFARMFPTAKLTTGVPRAPVTLKLEAVGFRP